jgi:hypothetical protein
VRPRYRARNKRPEDVFVTIGEPLSQLVGSNGYRALLERSLDIAAEEHSVLRTVRPALAPVGRLVGLQIRRRHEMEVIEALSATLSVLLHTLVEFLGSDLVWYVLRGAPRESRPLPQRQTASTGARSGALSASDVGIQ